MPVIKYRKVLENVFRKPVFGPEDLHNEGVPENYAKKRLFMLVKAGKIKRIERGKYTRLDDPITVAAHITEPCYLSLWTAMSIRSLTAQVPFAVEVVTSRKRFKRRIDFDGTRIVFYTVSPKMMFGYEYVIWRENVSVAVANPEKIVIDAVYFRSIPEKELLEIIKSVDIQKLRRYAELTSSKRIKNKIVELIKCSRVRK